MDFSISDVEKQHKLMIKYFKTRDRRVLSEIVDISKKEHSYLKSKYASLVALCLKKHPIHQNSWHKKEQDFLNKYTNQDITWSGFQVKQKIFLTISLVRNLIEKIRPELNSFIAETYIEDFLYRSEQLTDMLKKFYKGGLNKPDLSKVQQIKDLFEKDSYFLTLKKLRNSITHQGHVSRFTEVVGIPEQNTVLIKPILYRPKEHLLHTATLNSWKNDWVLNIKYFLQVIYDLLEI